MSTKRWVRAAVVVAVAVTLPAGLRVAHAGQLPDDVNPESRSRLPPIDREELDPARRAAFDAAVASPDAAPAGAAALRLHGSGASLRFEAPMGRRLTELTVLATAREYDQPYEWALHELEALAVGLDDEVIDVVRPGCRPGRRSSSSSGASCSAPAPSGPTPTRGPWRSSARPTSSTSSTSWAATPRRRLRSRRSTSGCRRAGGSRCRCRSRTRTTSTPSPASRTAVAELYGRMLSPSGIGPGVIRSYGAGQETLEARVGRRLMQLAILVTARAHDSQYDWTVNEPRAREAGLETEIIDLVRDGGALEGVGEKDAALIAFGRELFGDHNVRAETYSRAERAFGVENLVDIVALMGAHAADAAVLAAFDQHLPEGVEPLLPLPQEAHP